MKQRKVHIERVCFWSRFEGTVDMIRAYWKHGTYGAENRFGRSTSILYTGLIGRSFKNIQPIKNYFIQQVHIFKV